jgi:superfamily II DNA or RNA helicase
MFSPRPYQQEALEEIEAAYGRGVKSALLVLPTGTGKTNVFSWLIQRRHQRGDRRPTLVIAHREELLTQAQARIRQIAPELRVDLERAERKASMGASVVVASVQTIGRPGSRRLAWMTKPDSEDGLLRFGCDPPGKWDYPGLVIIDEAHHAAAAGYQCVLERFAGPETQVLGCTATPKRFDRKAIHGHEQAAFQEVAFSYPILQAIKDGWLADIRGYRVDGGADLSSVRTTAGDYNAGDLARKVDAPERTEAALKHWAQVAGDRRTIVFCCGVEHAQHAAEAFRERGITAEAADGSLGREERAAIIDRFRRGETQVLCNCDLFTEGFDVPEAACALLLRPTQSWSLYVQMVGRVTRLAEGKSDAVVIDVVDNCNRHSLASVPAILDLPPMDLQGQSLAKAAAAIEEMGAQAAVLQKALPGSWSELQTLLTRVDLFASIEPPAELEGHSAFAWLGAPGGYRLDCGEGRQARVQEDALGALELLLTARSASPGGRALLWRQRLGTDLHAAMVEAEQVVGEWWPNCKPLVIKSARWHGDPPTDKQLHWLRKLGVEECVVETITKGQARALLDQLFARPKQAASARR